MRVQSCLLLVTATLALAACDKQANDPSPDTVAAATKAGFVTGHAALARTLVPQASIKPIITVGDPIPGQESNADPEQRVWAPIPDGLGAYNEGGKLVLFANHEISSGGVDGRFPYARVSRLELDPATISVTGGAYPVTGK